MRAGERDMRDRWWLEYSTVLLEFGRDASGLAKAQDHVVSSTHKEIRESGLQLRNRPRGMRDSFPRLTCIPALQKSMILKLVARIYDVTEGTIWNPDHGSMIAISGTLKALNLALNWTIYAARSQFCTLFLALVSPSLITAIATWSP